jgi:hypothetical protein
MKRRREALFPEINTNHLEDYLLLVRRIPGVKESRP